MTERISEERLRNTRAWAAARVGSLSGADVIVGAIDELLERRAADEPPAGMAAILKTPTANDCWEAVNALIKPGDLGGNGCDQNAQRNGLILAANVIAALIHPQTEGSRE